MASLLGERRSHEDGLSQLYGRWIAASRQARLRSAITPHSRPCICKLKMTLQYAEDLSQALTVPVRQSKGSMR